jgi:hypothetical protein
MIFGFSFLSVKFTADDIDYILTTPYTHLATVRRILLRMLRAQYILSANDA